MVGGIGNSNRSPSTDVQYSYDYLMPPHRWGLGAMDVQWSRAVPCGLMAFKGGRQWSFKGHTTRCCHQAFTQIYGKRKVLANY